MLARKRARVCSSVSSNQPATASSVAVAISVGPGESVSSGNPASGSRAGAPACRAAPTSSPRAASRRRSSRKCRSSKHRRRGVRIDRGADAVVSGNCLPLTNRSCAVDERPAAVAGQRAGRQHGRRLHRDGVEAFDGIEIDAGDERRAHPGRDSGMCRLSARLIVTTRRAGSPRPFAQSRVRADRATRSRSSCRSWRTCSTRRCAP